MYGAICPHAYAAGIAMYRAGSLAFFQTRKGQACWNLQAGYVKPRCALFQTFGVRYYVSEFVELLPNMYLVRGDCASHVRMWPPSGRSSQWYLAAQGTEYLLSSYKITYQPVIFTG